METYKGRPINFECLSCGYCCQNILKENDGKVRGLILTPNEAKLFPKGNISPSVGRGINNWNINSIISYQLNVNECPFLDRNNLCKIYEKRPIACRRFPLMWAMQDVANIAYSKDCEFIRNLVEELGYELMYTFTPDTFVNDDCWNALRTERRSTLRAVTDTKLLNMRIFRFDLKTKQYY